MADSEFYADIDRFNRMYRLPAPEAPHALGAEQVRRFHSILSEEVAEGLDLASRYEGLEEQHAGAVPPAACLELLTELSDWLGDLVVYCASEARRWGVPLPEILRVIMASNFSKLGADGQPIYDERGKVMKGPGYWRPEPKIREVLSTSVGVDGRQAE